MSSDEEQKKVLSVLNGSFLNNLAGGGNSLFNLFIGVI